MNFEEIEESAKQFNRSQQIAFKELTNILYNDKKKTEFMFISLSS